MDNLESIRSIVEEFKIPDKCLVLYNIDPSTLSEYVQVALVPNSKRYTQMPVIIAENQELHYEDEDHPMIQHTSEQTILSEKFEEENVNVTCVDENVIYNVSDNDFNVDNKDVNYGVNDIGTCYVRINVDKSVDANTDFNSINYQDIYNTSVHNDNFKDVNVNDIDCLVVNDTISSIADSPVNTQFSLPLPPIHDKSLYKTTTRNKNIQTSDDMISFNGDNYFDNTLPSEPFYGLHDDDK